MLLSRLNQAHQLMMMRMSTKVQISNDLNGYQATWKEGTRLATAEDPAVVVLQEWWGVNDEIKHQAQLIADRGFVSLIPDLYRGKVGLDVAEAQHLMDGLDWPRAIADVHHAVAFLRRDNPSRKVGVLGFCMGGALSFLAAATPPTQGSLAQLNGAVSFYGLPFSAEDEGEGGVEAKLVRGGVPIQGHFGVLDQHEGFSDIKSMRTFEKRLRKQGSCHEPFYFYDTQGHGFMNVTPWYQKARVELGRPPTDHAVIALAWERVFDFFKQHLQ